ncbi:MFS transporter [Subtercola sp. YIM 133946]|uniref:MFS transporter n=1 Tax=Subtercola sp. YIM 133946 TaxID=3118909 RepID=UPI002F9250FE
MTQPNDALNAAPDRGRPLRAANAAWIGSALEYYDFFIYGTSAALVFGVVFFPSSDPLLGTLLAIATYGVGYLARPVGALVLGHFGDRFGRKRILLATVLMMGASTFLVGCLPGYAQIGAVAPVLLVFLRLLQGFSAGAEQSGANSISLENAAPNHRAFVTSFTLVGTQAGQILATAVFIPIATLPKDDLYSWGWRIPFWLSAVVVLIAYFIRRGITETPVFETAATTGTLTRAPLKVLFADHWHAVIRVICAALIAAPSTVFTVYALSYAVNQKHLDATTMLVVGVLANVAALVSIPLWARLSDRIGRKPVFIGGSIGIAITMLAYLWAISIGNYPLIFVFGILMFGIVYTATSAVWPAFYGEMFPTSVRLSGTAFGTQIGFAISGFVPTIAAAVAGNSDYAWLIVAGIIAVVVLINIVAVATGRETYRTPMAELGLTKQERALQQVGRRA